jgi:GAF domain-containing protein
MTRRSVEGRGEHPLAARYAVAAGALAAAAAAQYGLQLLYGGPFPLTFFPAAVLVAAWYGGFGPGLLTTLGGAVVATYSFLRPAQGQPGAASDVIALLLFTLAGLLISVAVRQLRRNARSEREVRRETEKQLRQTDRLQQLTGALLQARTLGDVIATCLPELLYAIDARAGALFLIVDDGAECALAHAVGYTVDGAAEGRRWPVNADSPLGRAMRRRELVIVEGAEAPPVDAAEDLTLEWRNGDVLIPLLTAGRTIGAVSLSITPSRALGGDECEFLLRAGRYAAQAIDRAQLYETAERARAEAEALRVRADSDLRERQKAEEALRWSEARYRALAARTSRLYELSAGLSKAVTLAAVAKVIVRLGKVVVGASVGSVAMLVDGGTQFETLYSEEPLPPSPEGQRRFPAAEGMCGTAAVATQSPVFVGSFVEWQEKYPQSASIAADGGFVSSAALPLLADGAVLGVLSFHFTVPVNFDEEYTALLTSVAQHCAQRRPRARAPRPRRPTGPRTTSSPRSRTSCARR